jgi:hypothetical protein
MAKSAVLSTEMAISDNGAQYIVAFTHGNSDIVYLIFNAVMEWCPPRDLLSANNIHPINEKLVPAQACRI